MKKITKQTQKKSELEEFIELFYISAFEHDDISSSITNVDLDSCTFSVERFNGFSPSVSDKVTLSFKMFSDENLGIKNIFDLNEFLKPKLKIKKQHQELLNARVHLASVLKILETYKISREAESIKNVISVIDKIILELNTELEAYNKKLADISSYIEVD
jgi:hypothetical protein